jgi:glycosyltransferase involved in cell wall biosynthesis
VRLLVDGRYIQDHFPGIGRYVYELVRALAGLGGSDLEIRLLIDPAARNTRFDLGELADRVKTVPGPPVFHSAAPAILAGLERRLRPDVVHYTHYFRPWIRGAPSVLTIHDLIPLECPASMPSRTTRLVYRVFNWVAVRLSDVVVVPSAATAAALKRRFRGIQPRVVPEGVGRQFRPLSAEAVEGFRRSKALPAVFCHYHGSNKPHKNLAGLLAALALVADRSTVLVLSGHFDPRLGNPTRLPAAHPLAGRVRYLGPVSEAELVGLLNAAQVFVYPTLAEGFGLPVLEAMACGRAVVTSAGTATAEVAGDAALLVDARNPAAIAGAIDRLLGEPALAEELGRKSLARAAEYTWERTAARTLEAYQAALKPG